MFEYNSWSIKNVRLAQVLPLAVATASIAFSGPAHAAGTAAGSTITNTATASYDDAGGNTQTVNSNPVNLLVDELIDVSITPVGDTTTAPGATGQVLAFTVTNTGNGSETFSLAANTVIGGDQYDPTLTSIVIDSNGNGVYDPGVDTVYNAGVNDPVLAPDTPITVFVVVTTPSGVANGDRAQVSLTATSTTGTGAPGTSIAGAGQGGGAAVIGASGGDDVDSAYYIVQAATISFLKSQSVVDPFGGSTVVPGSIVTYTLTATIGGTGSLANVVIGDNIPTGTTYQSGTITLQSVAKTDAIDVDEGRFEPAAGATPDRVRVFLGSVPAGQVRTVTFKVKVN